jgi:hypothetical protein
MLISIAKTDTRNKLSVIISRGKLSNRKGAYGAAAFISTAN